MKGKESDAVERMEIGLEIGFYLTKIYYYYYYYSHYDSISFLPSPLPSSLFSPSPESSIPYWEPPIFIQPFSHYLIPPLLLSGQNEVFILSFFLSFSFSLSLPLSPSSYFMFPSILCHPSSLSFLPHTPLPPRELSMSFNKV